MSEKYNISQLDIFSINLPKRSELCNLHSVLLFMYSRKIDDNSEVNFKYSEISWLGKKVVKQSIEKLSDMGVIEIQSLPTKVEPWKINLKTNEEVQIILNKERKMSFEKYVSNTFTKKDFAESLGCSKLREHFVLKNTASWIKNVNSGTWSLPEFLILSKIISYFDSDEKVKTLTLQKYMGLKTHFIINKVRFLYGKIPINRKDIVSIQLQNTLKDLKVKHDGSFEGMVKSYLKKLKGPSMAPEKDKSTV